MKKKIFATLVVAVGVAFAGYNMMKSQNEKNVMPDLLLANVEALAASRGEIPEVEITCGGSGGRCWEFDGYCYKGEYTYNKCKFNGSTYSSCSSNC